MKITKKFLESKRACAYHVALFAEEWPEGAEVTLDTCLRAAQIGLDFGWAADNLLSADGRRCFWAKLVLIDAEWEAKRNAIGTDWEAKSSLLVADWRAKRAPIDAEWRAKLSPIDAEWQAKRDVIDAEYIAARELVDAERETALFVLFYEIFAKENT